MAYSFECVDTAGDLSARYEHVYLVSTLEGMDGLNVHELLHHSVLQEDAVSTTDVACHLAHFSCSLSAVGLGSANHAYRRLALIEQLRQSNHGCDHTLAHGEHLRELQLRKLECGDWLSKLLALHCVVEGCLIGARGNSHCAPCHLNA